MKYYRFSFYFFVSVVFTVSAFFMSTAQAARTSGDLCKVGSTFGVIANGSGDYDGQLVCNSSGGSLLSNSYDALDQNDSCGENNGIYTGVDTDCAVNNSSTSFDLFSGSNSLSCASGSSYQNGVCVADPIPPTPSDPPATPTGFTDLSATDGQTPGGTQQSMCVNASPFIGGGAFVVSGTVLCYTGAGQNSDIFAYSDPVVGASEGWNGLNTGDLWARDDITAQGTLSVYDGAQVYAGNDGLQVTDNNILSRVQDGDNESSINITPTSITSSVTDGTNTSSVTIEADSIVSSSTDGTDTSSITINPTTIAINAASSATLQAGSNVINVDKGTSGSSPGVTIDGTVSGASTSTTGVLITGSGQNSESYTNDDRAQGSIPTWADIAIQSKSYGDGDPTKGSAILVTDYGVQIISPQPIAGQKITNNTAINNSTGIIVNNNGSNTSSGSVENNNGMNSGSGSVVNNTGGTSGSGSATNNIGVNTSTTGGTATNNVGGITGNGTVANSFGNNESTTGGTANNTIGMSTGNGTTNNQIGGSSGSGPTTNEIGQNSGTGTMDNSFGGGTGNSTNNIGTGTGISTNTIGSQTIGSTNTIQAGYTTSFMANGIATTAVNPDNNDWGLGYSILENPAQKTRGNFGIVLKDATNASYTSVDANGKLSSETGTVTQTSASMTVTNGYGNTHGFYVDEQQATISGGTRSSSLTLNDYGARFSNSTNGSPIQVTGVADGTGRYDAVNIQQLDAIKIGIAGVAAMNNIPSLETGKNINIGFAIGGFDSQTSFAVGANLRLAEEFVIKASASRGFQGNDSNISTTTWGVGGALSW